MSFDIYADIWNDQQVEEVKNLNGPILITGVSGFIGSKLFFSLKKIRADVYGCSRQPSLNWRLSGTDNKNLISVDLTDYNMLAYVIRDLRPRTVFHLGAYGAYSRQTDPSAIHNTNYIGTLNLLRILYETGCDAFVNAGSSSEYGVNCVAPGENDELKPNSDYAVSKVASSYLIKYYGEFLSFPSVNLRLYSVYGPWEERDRLIPRLISSCLKGKYPPFVDKRISRDFVYIDDCTHAMVRACSTACKTSQGVSINIASGVKKSLEEVALVSKNLFNIEEAPVFGSMPNRKWDLADWYGNPSAALNIMQWQAKTSFEDGLKYTAEWEKAAEQFIKFVKIPQKKKKISGIFACYKDNQSIPLLYERITKVFQDEGIDYEIIFVNDCSPNNDEDVIAGLAAKDYHVIGISHSRNFGSQSAFLSGMEIATGDAVVLMDGDGQDPPEVISEFISKWEKGYAVVYGQRVKRDAPLHMQFFYKLFYRVFSYLSEIKIPFDAGDFSLIDRKAIEHILKMPEKDVFLRGLRAWVGFPQIGIPYTRPERLFGKSTNNFFKNIWWAKKGIFSFSMKPLHYIQVLGVLISIFTFFLSIFYIVNYFINPPKDSKGITTIILLVLGLSSVQILSISILGDYINKITEEAKNRPRYIRNKIITNGQIYESEKEISNVINKLQKNRMEGH